jgi:muramoyltetrapeptide carboxypeptidase
VREIVPPVFVRPAPLPARAHIGVCALSGVVDAGRLAEGVAQIEALGHRVTLAGGIDAQWRYFAGDDTTRLAGFNALLNDPSIDMIMMARGGYGLSRLLHRIDWAGVAAAKKAIIGFSDFTAFNLAALKLGNFVTFAGPMAAIDFSAQPSEDHAFTQRHLWPALRGDEVAAGAFADSTCGTTYSAQKITGPIWGSNLSLLAHLAGTPFMPEVDSGILFVEEIAEQPYAIERLFFQLFHAGILQKQKALILADFSDCEPEAGRFPYTMEHVVETLRELLPYPVLTGLPFGHVARKLTIPFGAPATLAIEDGAYRLTY